MRECPVCHETFWNESIYEMHTNYCGRKRAVKQSCSSLTTETVSTEFTRMKIRRKLPDATGFDIPALSSLAVDFNREILTSAEVTEKLRYSVEKSKMATLLFMNVALVFGYYFLV